MLLLDMLNKSLHPARRAFRKVLLGLLALSVLFFLCVVAMRIYYHDRHVDGAMQTAVLEYDVFQHKARAFVADDAQDMVIIKELFKLGFFSRIYTEAGYEMLQYKADEGYEPAIALLADVDDAIQASQ